MSDRRSHSTNETIIPDTITALLKEGIHGRIPSAKLSELRRKLGSDELMDELQNAFYEELQVNRKRAMKFVKFIQKKTEHTNMPLHTILQKAEKYKKQNKMSDMQFAEFKRIFEKMYTGKDTKVDKILPTTNLAMLFGDIYSVDGINVKESDYPIVQDIIKLYTMTRGSHTQVVLQSMQYNSDLSKELQVLNAYYDRNHHSLHQAVHPVIVAMFVPKMMGLETHFLYTNIAHVVKSKYNKERIDQHHDLLLLDSMIRDSVDVVCSSSSTMQDLRMRANIQINLWNSVLQMRSGKFYDVVNTDFFAAVDECKIFRHDAPDLLYTGDESIVLRRLLSAMSFNPIDVVTQPVFGMNIYGNPMNLPVINNSIMSRPFIVCRIGAPSDKDPEPDKIPVLANCHEQMEAFKEENKYVPKHQKILDVVGGVVIYYIQRRSIEGVDNVHRFISPVPKFNQLPLHVLANERLNLNKVEVSTDIDINDNTYNLVSGVFLRALDPDDKTTTFIDPKGKANNIIKGCNAFLFNGGNIQIYKYKSPDQATGSVSNALNTLDLGVSVPIPNGLSYEPVWDYMLGRLTSIFFYEVA